MQEHGENKKKNKPIKKMLALPGVFLPHNSTIAILSYKLLRKLDYDIDVLAMHTEDDDGLKEELENDGCYQKFSVSYTGEYRYALFERNNKRILKLIFNNSRYIRHATKQSLQQKYDVVFSLSLPNFSHLAGYRVKKKNKNIKWIASFSDPIKDNPMHGFMKKEYKGIVMKTGYFITRLLNSNAICQKRAFKHADKLVFVSEEQRDFMTNGHKELIDKSIVVPFTYIREWPLYQKLIIGQKTPNNRPKRIVHLGNVYGARRIDSLIKGIKIAKKRMPEIHQKIVIEHYGNMEQRQKKLISENQADDMFITHERIPYAETLKIMNESDVLLLLDVYIDKDKLQPFMPSKFIEYFLTNKLIFSIANCNSPIFRHLKNLEHITVPDDPEKIAQALIEVSDRDCYVDNDYEVYENQRVILKTLATSISEWYID